jgi:hypothetical protein
MKTLTFTPRDMNRQPAKILAAARRLGSVEIRTRSGEAFTLAVKAESAGRKEPGKMPDLEARRQRLKELGWTPLPTSKVERFNRIIAGEE